VHTENRGKKVGPGEQIANNKTMHGTIQLFENESGEYYPVVNWDDRPALVRSEYYPIGNRIQFPKKWGRKWGAQKLLESIIIDKKKQITDAELELEKLTACLDKVMEWED
jgi:hypothetical protein